MEDIVKKIQEELRNNITDKVLNSQKKYFKEDVTILGVSMMTVSKISKEIFKEIKKEGKQKIFGVCKTLWQSAYIEEHIFACNLSYYIHEQYQPDDFMVFDKWVNKYVNNWATCDTLCNHTVGTFVEMYPEYVSELKNWAKSTNRWVKRGAAVTFIISARKGMFLKDILEIADMLLLDTDDLVQKGYGWMLKAASEAHQKEVFNYVMTKKDVMPRTALRYAIEKMPPEMRTLAMEKPKNKK